MTVVCPSGKTFYLSSGQARQAARGLKQRGRLRVEPSNVDVYPCRQCGGFHLGRRGGFERRKARGTGKDRRRG